LTALESLKKRADFLAVNHGLRSPTPAFVLLGKVRLEASLVPPQLIRFGLTVTRKVGNAVVRNRIRRRLRAIARGVLRYGGKPGWDYVLIARDAALARDFKVLGRDLESALEMLHKAGEAPSAGAARARSGGKSRTRS
jgi:ribonuclease P protein component